jgi:hypothetical protein
MANDAAIALAANRHFLEIILMPAAMQGRLYEYVERHEAPVYSAVRLIYSAPSSTAIHAQSPRA